jgi:small subunit ribosomal protein S6
LSARRYKNLATPQSDYELMYILDVTKGEDEINTLVEKFKTLVESNGTLNEQELIGKRRLAYAIDDMPEGYYVLIKFTSPHDFPAELSRVLGITEGVMRSLITKAVEPKAKDIKKAKES